jgi:hypothetical protein
MFAAGLSASEIAERFNRPLSRSAVVGKLHRLGLRRKKQAEEAATPSDLRPTPVMKARPFNRWGRLSN